MHIYTPTQRTVFASIDPLTNGKAKKSYIYDPGPRPREFAATGGLYTIFRVLIGAHLYLQRAVSKSFQTTQVYTIPLNPYAERE